MAKPFSLLVFAIAAAIVPLLQAGELTSAQLEEAVAIECGNLTYAGNKTSVCFADKFLSRLDSSTSLRVRPKFRPVRLDSDELFEIPFCILSGEGSFSFTEKERANLRHYLATGGFVLSSPGCSDKAFDKSLRKEISALFPDKDLAQIPMDHLIFQTVNKVDKLTTRGNSRTLIEGLTIDGRLAMVYSTEGLNDVANAKGCCCCGGNEIRESAEVNINILTYALLY